MNNFKQAPPDISVRVKSAMSDKLLTNPHNRKVNKSNIVTRTSAEYKARLSITQDDREREEENHKLFMGLEFDQLHPDLIKMLEESGQVKDLSQFNVIQKACLSVLGYMQKNGQDIDFLSTDGSTDELLEIMKDLYFFDKEACDWEREITDARLNGVIYSGELMMYKDFSVDPIYGNIGVKSMPPGSVLRDPQWTNNHSGDCRSVFTVRRMRPDEIKDRYGNKAELIDAYVRMLADQVSTSKGYQKGELPYSSPEEVYNSAYPVIEHHYMKREKKKSTVGITYGMTPISIPDDADEEWYRLNNVIPGATTTSEEWRDYYYVTTICPDLCPVEPLEDGLGSLQVGRIPIFQWSYNRHGGRNAGIPDLLRDPQRFINEMIQLIHDTLANGKKMTFIDENIFDGDEAKMLEVKKKYNDPRSVAFVDMSDGTDPVKQGGQVVSINQETAFIERIIALKDQMVTFTQSLQGIGEGERSGLLFEMKHEAAETGMSPLQESQGYWINEIAEGWFYAAQALNGGIYRSFVNNKGDRRELNSPQPDNTVKNDITQIPRAKIIVRESEQGLSRRTNKKMTAYQAAETFGPMFPESIPVWVKMFLESSDGLTQSAKETAIQLCDMKIDATVSGLMAQDKGAEAQVVNSEMMIQQMVTAMTQGAMQAAMGGQQQPVNGQAAPQQEQPIAEEQAVQQLQ